MPSPIRASRRGAQSPPAGHRPAHGTIDGTKGGARTAGGGAGGPAATADPTGTVDVTGGGLRPAGSGWGCPVATAEISDGPRRQSGTSDRLGRQYLFSLNYQTVP